MPNHYQPYPYVDSRQHKGLGNSPESTNTENIKLNHASAKTVLMSKGNQHDTSGRSGSNPRTRDLLLPEDAGWYGILRSRAGFHFPDSDDRGAESALHSGSHSGDGETDSRGNKHRANRSIIHSALWDQGDSQSGCCEVRFNRLVAFLGFAAFSAFCWYEAIHFVIKAVSR
jgi:hypothetical protein